MMTQQSSLLLCVATSAGLSAIPPEDMMVDEVEVRKIWQCFSQREVRVV